MVNFIRLNKICENGNYDIFVNAEHIVSFAKGHSNGGTYVNLVNLNRIEVAESEDEILEKLGQEVVCTSVLLDKEAVKIKANTILLGGRTDD